MAATCLALAVRQLAYQDLLTHKYEKRLTNYWGKGCAEGQWSRLPIPEPPPKRLIRPIMPVLFQLEKQSMKEPRLKLYSLPKLNHRRRGVGVGDVGGVFSVVVNAVLCGDAKV